MIVVKGYRISQGEFTPDGKTEVVQFNNCILYVDTNEVADVIGVANGTVKVKIKNVRKIGFTNWDDILNHEVILGYAIGRDKPEVTSVTKVSDKPVVCSPVVPQL